MGATREQKFDALLSEVEWLNWRERLRVVLALLFSYAKDSEGRRLTTEKALDAHYERCAGKLRSEED